MYAYEEGNHYDLTARGLSITVTINGKSVLLTDFPDDLDPITIDEAEFAEIKMDANGEWFRQQKPTPISLHISLIPGSNAELAMSDFIKDAMFGNSDTKADLIVTYPNEKKHRSKTYKKGYMTGCSLGYSATSQGRVRTKQFSFKFPIQNP